MGQRLYEYYGQWTAVDLHKNHWLKNQIDEVATNSYWQLCDCF